MLLDNNELLKRKLLILEDDLKRFEIRNNNLEAKIGIDK